MRKISYGYNSTRLDFSDVPSVARIHLLGALIDHAQVRVERDAHGSVKWNLECRAHILGALSSENNITS